MTCKRCGNLFDPRNGVCPRCGDPNDPVIKKRTAPPRQKYSSIETTGQIKTPQTTRQSPPAQRRPAPAGNPPSQRQSAAQRQLAAQRLAAQKANKRFRAIFFGGLAVFVLIVIIVVLIVTGAIGGKKDIPANSNTAGDSSSSTTTTKTTTTTAIPNYFTGYCTYLTTEKISIHAELGGMTNSIILSEINAVTPIFITKIEGNWGKTSCTIDGQLVNGFVQMDTLEYIGKGDSTYSSETYTLVENTYSVKDQEGLRLTRGASNSTDVLLRVPDGASISVSVISSSGRGLTTYNGETGWVTMSYCTLTGENGTATTGIPITTTTSSTSDSSSSSSSGTKSTGSYTVSSGSIKLKLRSTASTSGEILAEIESGTTITVTQISGDWGKVTYNGKTGWVSMKYCTAN